MFSSILFSHSVSMLITKVFNFYIVNYLCFLSIFQEFSLVLWIETNSGLLILINFLFLSIRLGETITFYCLERVSLCGSIPIPSPCAQWLWWEVWIWQENRSCLSSGFTGSYPLNSRWAGDGGAMAKARYELWLPLCSVAFLVLLVAGSVSKAKTLKVGSELAQFPLSVWFPPIPCSQHWHSSPREEKCYSNRIWQGVPSTGPGIAYGWSDRSLPIWCTTWVSASNGCLHLLRFYFVPYSISLP